jgi:DNA invertase Pin-like site-specific DNA recombinase
MEESIQDQELLVEQYLRDHQLGRIIRKYPEVVSAFKETAKRTKYESALTDLRVGIIGGIAVYRWDRLARRAMELPRIIELLRACGGRLLILDSDFGTIDTGDESKELQSAAFLKIMHEMAQQAEAESQATSARITRWHIRRASRGNHHRGGVRAYGYTDDMLGLVTVEVELLKEASRRVREGEPIARITADWTRRGVLTAQGKLWHPRTLKQILTNPRLVGCREFGGQTYDLRDVPAVFERDEWETLCAKLAERSQHNGPRERHLCSNIAMCGAVCGFPLLAHNEGYGRMAYACQSRPKYPSACGGVSIDRAFLDEQVSQAAIGFLRERQRIQAVLDARTSEVDLAELHAERERLNESERELVRRLNPPRGVPRLPGALVDSELLRIAEERRDLDMRQAISTESGLLTEALGFGESAAKVWEERPLIWRRQMLTLICKRIEVMPFRGVYAKGKKGGSQLDPSRLSVTFADE